MQTFEELLKVSLHGANENFKRANSDLHRIVNEVSEAVLKLTSGKHGLVLETAKEDDSEVFYELALRSKPRPNFLDVGFTVSTKGYPIQAGRTDPDERASPVGKWIAIKDEQSLRKFFEDLVGNPDSVLVQRLAFSMRRVSKNVENDDDIPF